MKVETSRVHAVDKSLKIKSVIDGKEGLHPYDTEIPEKDAHQLAAVEAIKWAGFENFDVVGIEPGKPGHFTTEFKRV